MTSSFKEEQILSYLNNLRNVYIEGPRIGNIYLQDQAIQKYTHKYIGGNKQFQKQLTRLGDRFANEYLVAARNAEMFVPVLQQFDSYGRRIDKLHLSEGWKTESRFSAEDGIVALAYEKDQFKLEKYQRLGQLIVLTMYQASSGLYGCPLAMTDGAAFILRNQLAKGDINNKEFLSDAFRRLTSRNPNEKWTSGQWMTEKKGGSDVSQTETIAIKTETGYKLYGYKWFSSATDSNMTLALAKIVPPNTKLTQKQVSQLPLSMFLAKIRNQDGELNNIQIVRLKDKLGTHQLPTAELVLKGTDAIIVGQQSKGVRQISNMLSVTRLYNAATAVGVMRRITALAKDYAFKRTTGKTPLHELPLHVSVLADMQITYRGNLSFYLKVSQLFSLQQSKTITPLQAGLLRTLIPILKLYTGKQCVRICSEGLESFGGMGYIEGTMLPTLARDAQVLTIWEGTTNVLSHDLARSLLTSKLSNPLEPYVTRILSITELYLACENKVSGIDTYQLKLIEAHKSLVADLSKALEKKFKNWEHELRSFAFGIARIYIAYELLNEVVLNPDEFNILTYKRWIDINQPLYSLRGTKQQQDRTLGLEVSREKGRAIGGKDSRGCIRPRF